MFDLPGDSFPADAEALRDGVESAVRRRLRLPPDAQPVTVEPGQWPQAEALEVNLTGGRLELPRDPRELRRQAQGDLKPPVICTGRREGPHFDRFAVRGEPVHVDDMPCMVRLEGRDVGFDYGHDENGAAVMAPARGEGHLQASVPRDRLIGFIRRQAIEAAAEKGVTLDDVDVAITAPGPREVLARGSLHGHRKLGFLSPSFTLDFICRVEVDGDLVGHMRQLDVHGRGIVMEALLVLLRPRLEQIRSEPVPLREVLGAFIPSSLGLRDFAINVGEDVSLRAEFSDATRREVS